MIYKASLIFTGQEMLQEHAMLVKDGVIETIMPKAEINTQEEIVELGNVILLPAFIDIQLYGAFGRLLSEYPDIETISGIVKYCAEGGAAYCLPTVATNTYDTIFHCIDALKSYWQQGGKSVIGLHVEGPWINPAKRGAHREEWIFSPTIAQAKELLDYGNGIIKIITLAPECVSQEVIDLIRSYNIIISAGHSNATYEQATGAFEKGLNLTTHLFNAMSPLQHRAPGLVGAVFNHPKVLCSIVPDGHHVDFSAIQIAKKIMGNRLFVITDAVTETSQGYYKHQLDGDKYTSNGILSGSALTMYKAFQNLTQHCGIDTEEAIRMCSLYPAMALGMQNKIGVLKQGAKADIIVVDKNFQFLKLINS
ncbi:N-acetylglucosamine-6-phosphate deacetylase [Panacibacter ginsenosidivorans]|uniref:N-acetylglucosamine-6-phosphate deacetylase n=1 Tax=Panacibacter ginsenosidivorans TaxID=1813871 RepID=A0A5B8V8P3_9BACT|nr:N-acetylglucosamine-6-phosphate deacetylase [Panacibacter ginsenosidivorans]QEC67712.1 N-acetylglucosamine-6-phosphate deacetylase [Panacibacter ginsenosidivorans]